MIDRRTIMTAALAAIAGHRLAHGTRMAQAGMSRITAYAFSFPGVGRRRYQARRIMPAGPS